jgi:hypothetical protein
MVSNKSAGQMMYLPLDKWMQEEGVARKPVSGAAALPEATMTATPSQAPSLRENLRSREAR